MKTLALVLIVVFSLLAAPLAAEAQQAGRVYRMGFLRSGPPPETFIEGFRQGLRELGYIEGQSITIEYGLADSTDRLPGVVTELVRRQVDVILASGTPPAVAAKNATKTIPIVFVASIDPVASGMVASLARPGGNVTGLAGIHADLMGKRLELLREAVPRLSRVTVLSHAANPGNVQYIRQGKRAAEALGVQLQVVGVQDAGDFDRVFSETRGASAQIQLDDVLFTSHRTQLVQLAARNGLPVMYGFKEFVRGGRPHGLRARLPRPVSTRRHVRGQDPQGRQARRPAHRAAHEVRAGHQPCVQRKLTCSAGVSPAGVRARAP